MASYAPVVLFVYKRLDLTIRTLEALQKNTLAKFSSIYIFSDAANSQKDAAQVSSVREYIKNVGGFASVEVIESTENYGCAKSVISGVSKIFEQYEKMIVLEDDLVTTPNFLDYMNAALDHYAANKKVFSIAGWSIAINFDKNDPSDVYYLPRTCSWGWASWKDRWQDIDWGVADYNIFKTDRVARAKFDIGGADLSKMLDSQMEGKINSWAIRWCYAQYKKQMLTVFPKTAKAKNIGFASEATHTVNNPNYPLDFDNVNKTIFNFNDDVAVDPKLLKQNSYYFTLHYRTKNRLLNYVRRFL